MAKIAITEGPGVFWSTIKTNLNLMFTELYGLFNTSVQIPSNQINNQIDDYTPVLGDAGYGVIIKMDKATPLTLTVPTNIQVAFPIGSEIAVVQTGTGVLTIEPYDGTVTINCYIPPPYTLNVRYSTAALKKIDTNVWLLTGAF